MTARAPAQMPARQQVILGLRREWNEDARQLVAVLVLALVALILGYGVREIATSATRTVTAGGVTANIPQSWILQSGASDLLFTAFDPRNAGQRYSVTKPSLGETDPGRVADRVVASKAQILQEFQVLGRGTTAVNGQNAPTVTFVYVTSRNGGVPQVIEGRDLFLTGSSGVLIVTLESPSRSFDNAIPTFERFAASVKG